MKKVSKEFTVLIIVIAVAIAVSLAIVRPLAPSFNQTRRVSAVEYFGLRKLVDQADGVNHFQHPSSCKTIQDFMEETHVGNDAKKRFYEVRLGAEEKFNQKAYGGDFLIGKFNRFEGNTAFYTGGAHCGPIGKGREGTVELIEDRTLDKMMVTFAEIETCVYKAVIAVPSLCDSCMTIDDFMQETIAGHDPRKRFFFDVKLGAGYSYNQNSYAAGVGCLIGYFDRIEGNIAYFEGGEHCESTGKPREGMVEIIQDAALTDIEVSFTEPRQCEYKTLVAVPKLCDPSSNMDEKEARGDLEE